MTAGTTTCGSSEPSCAKAIRTTSVRPVICTESSAPRPQLWLRWPDSVGENGQARAQDLGRQERQNVIEIYPGKGVRKRPRKRHSRVGERSRGRKPVRRSDVCRNRKGRLPGVA